MTRFSLLLFILLCAYGLRAQGTWTWMNGSSSANGTAVWGTQGVPAPGNTPAAVYSPVNWTDLQGNFWVFGGYDFGSGNSYNALWRYEPATNQWTWMKGSSLPNQSGSYGVQGVPSPSNNPGSRGFGSARWTDQQGNLWMFGGGGFDSNGNNGWLSDLWKYDISTNEWTWVKGPNTINVFPVYGMQQVPAVANNPPALNEITANWVDSNGDLWFYGGFNFNPFFSDLWKYSIATNTWTWMQGSGQSFAQPVYGTQGIPAPSNTPGARMAYTHWTDPAGNFWYYAGADSAIRNTSLGAYDDMWKFIPSLNQWVWIAGSAGRGDSGQYVQSCIPGSRPGERTENRLCWTDACHRFWFYGGISMVGYRDDLWMFDPATNQFTWVNGSSGGSNSGNFGTITIGAPTNHPPGLLGSVSFTDLQGNFWLFGGQGNPTGGTFNALWKYIPDPSCPQVTPPVAQILHSPIAPCAPQTIHFYSGTTTTSYYWDFGDPSTVTDTSWSPYPAYTYTLSGTYVVTLVVTNTTPCLSASDTATFVVDIDNGYGPDLGSDTTFCSTPSYQLDAGTAESYLWSTGDTTQTIFVNTTGTYWVMTDSASCVYSDTIVISSVPPLSLGSNTFICGGQLLLLNAGPANSYTWSTGETTSSIEVDQPGTYWVETASGSCIQRDSITITGSEGSLFIPNAFTPDNNGLNDEFRTYGEGISSFRLLIFDRWGQLLFETEDQQKGWDGRYKGRLCEEDVYVYRLSYHTDCSGNMIEKTGHFSLVH